MEQTNAHAPTPGIIYRVYLDNETIDDTITDVYVGFTKNGNVYELDFGAEPGAYYQCTFWGKIIKFEPETHRPYVEVEIAWLLDGDQGPGWNPEWIIQMVINKFIIPVPIPQTA